MRLRAVLSILAFVCAALLGGEQKAEGRAIAVVKTWGDLASQPAVDLHKNATARFGVQAVRAPRFSGVMLYCMTEAYDPEDEADMEGGDRLGPFRLNVRRPDDDEKRMSGLEQQRVLRAPGKRDFGRLVFGQIVPLGKIGTYSVELCDAKGAVVASVKIESVDTPFQPWSALVNSDDDPPHDEELEGVSDSLIETAPGCAGLPKMDGGTPILYALAGGARGPRKFAEDDPLPVLPDVAVKEPAPLTAAQIAQAATWIAGLRSELYATRARATEALLALGTPAGDLLQNAARQTADAESLLRLRHVLTRLDGPFHIRMDGNKVLLKTPVFFPADDIENHILARWWVNGKPVKPNDELEPPERSEQGGAAANRDARFTLKFTAAALGAKTGDAIGLQLLFCPDGIRDLDEELAGPAPEKAAGESDRESEPFPDRFPVVSNTIEFTAP